MKMKSFKHKCDARNTDALAKVIYDHGAEGYGVYRALVETLHERGGIVGFEQTERIAFAMRTSEEIVHSVITEYGLFQHDNLSFWSTDVQLNIERSFNLSKVRSKCAVRRWKLHRESRPTLDDIKEYVIANCMSVEPEVFFDYYESKGWKIGGNTISDWKAALRNWQRRICTRCPFLCRQLEPQC
jgi:hypothetical protein